MNHLRIYNRTLLVGLTALGVTTAGMVSVPAANATCFSIFGVGNGHGCTSTLTSVAIGIGTGAVANASGFLGAAYAIGNGAEADASGIALALAAGPQSLAQVVGNLSAASATGTQGGTAYAEAQAGYDEFGNPHSSDFANIAVTLASDSYAVAGGLGEDFGVTHLGAGNVALNLGVGNNVQALGFLNSALAIGGSKPYGNQGNNEVYAAGTLNNASHIFGNGNLVQAGSSAKSLLNLAFNAFGNRNGAFAGSPGSFALAGAIFTNDATVIRETPGININGVKVPNTAAAVRAARAVKPGTAGAVRAARAVKPSAATTAKG